MAAEEKRLLEAIPAGAYLVALDEHGIAPTSVELAGYLKNGNKTAITSVLLLVAQMV